MQSRIRYQVACVAFSSILLASSAWSAEKATAVAQGRIFHDANGNSQFDETDRPLSNIRVSNGREIVRTDFAGQYQLPVDDDTILFVIKPSGWRTVLSDDKLPQFYYIHKPHGSPALKYPGVEPTGPLPASVDFALYPQREPTRFRAILFGDPQPRNQQEVDYIAHDVVEELIGADAAFGVTLGDIVFDDLSLFQPLNRTIALIDIPWYNVVGNHDINTDVSHDHHSDETFERTYGPTYYSFDHGPVHFIVLDDVEWYIPGEGKKGTYRGGLGPEQMTFVRNDLALIPDDQLVVLLMHIPLVDVHDRRELYRLIEQRPFCISVSGHTHTHRHHFIKKDDGWMGPAPHHHIVNVTVSGSWWTGSPDERGIPHTTMADGAPNGYSIITFDGTDYTLDFKAAGRPASYQMQVFAPEVVAAKTSHETHVFVNVFNGSEKSTVEMRLGRSDPWRLLKQVQEIDPGLQAVYEAEHAVVSKTKGWRELTKPKASSHLWKGPLPERLTPGVHMIEIRATDWQRRTHKARRVIRVTK